MSIRNTLNNAHPSYTASAPPDPATAFTFATWIRLQVDTNTFATVCRLHSGGGGSTCLVLGMNASGVTPALFSPANPTGITGADLALNTWYYLAGVIAGTAAALYRSPLGGPSAYTAGTITPGATPSGFTVLGRSVGDTSETVNGDMAYDRMWAAALTQAQLDAERDASVPVLSAGLFGSWPLPSAADLTDHANARNLVANAGALGSADDPPLTSPARAAFFHA